MNHQTIKHVLALSIAFAMSASLMQGAHAQTGTPTPTATKAPTESEDTSPLDDTIKSLKEKIEDKVEQINSTSKNIVSGVVTSVENGTVEVMSKSRDEFTVAIDDTITSFFSSTADESEALEETDVEEGSYIVVSGPIIEKQISANTLFIQTQYLVLHGVITTVDSSTQTIDVVTLEKDEYTLDIETTTVQNIIDSKTLLMKKATFSSYKVGDTIHFVVIAPEEEGDNVEAVRTLILPQEFFVDESITPTVAEAEEE